MLQKENVNYVVAFANKIHQKKGNRMQKIFNLNIKKIMKKKI